MPSFVSGAKTLRSFGANSRTIHVKKFENAKIKNRDSLLIAHSENMLDDEELLLLFDVNPLTNLNLPYWSYENFDLD